MCASRGGGVCFLGDGGIPVCTEADPPVNRMTDRCKNITLATTLLQPVNIRPLTTFTFSQCKTTLSRVENYWV